MSREGFSIKRFAEIVKIRKLTEITLPPTSLALLLQSDFAQIVDHECLKKITCVGSIVSESLRTKFSEVFPDKNLSIVFGMTELNVSATRPGEYKEKLSVGSFIFPNISLKIIGEDNQKLSPNGIGEIYIKPEFRFQVRFASFKRFVGSTYEV